MTAVETNDRYTGGDYLADNPGWHVADSAWKAEQILAGLGPARVQTVCEVGCGAGEVLVQLQRRLAAVRLVGFSARFTAVALDRPVQSRKARLARMPRRCLPRPLAARLLGGFSLLVVAENGG